MATEKKQAIKEEKTWWNQEKWSEGFLWGIKNFFKKGSWSFFLWNSDKHVFDDGTVIRTDVVEYNPLNTSTLQEYLDAGVITEEGCKLIDGKRYTTLETPYIIEVIEKSEIALIPLEWMVYVGAIMTRKKDEGVCYVEFRDWKWNTNGSYFPEEVVKSEEIINEIREIRWKNLDFKKWDKVFLNYWTVMILGRVGWVKGDKYEIEIWIITRDNFKGLGIIQRNIKEINKTNDDMISKIDTPSEEKSS